VTTSAFGAFSAISIYKGNEKFFDSIVMPVVHTLNPETSHRIAIIASKYGLFSRSSYEDPVTLVRYSLASLIPFNKLPQLVGIKQGCRLKNTSCGSLPYSSLMKQMRTGYAVAYVVSCRPFSCRGLGSITDQSMWFLWWTKWFWNASLLKYFDFSLSVSLH
jgi:hypothetical protein